MEESRHGFGLRQRFSSTIDCRLRIGTRDASPSGCKPRIWSPYTPRHANPSFTPPESLEICSYVAVSLPGAGFLTSLTVGWIIQTLVHVLTLNWDFSIFPRTHRIKRTINTGSATGNCRLVIFLPRDGDIRENSGVVVHLHGLFHSQGFLKYEC
jgi:hypothetical protein